MLYQLIEHSAHGVVNVAAVGMLSIDAMDHGLAAGIGFEAESPLPCPCVCICSP